MASEARFISSMHRTPQTESSTSIDSPKRKDRVSELIIQRVSSPTPSTSPILERKATPLVETTQTVQSKTPTISRVWRSNSDPVLPVDPFLQLAEVIHTEIESRDLQERLKAAGITTYDANTRLNPF